MLVNEPAKYPEPEDNDTSRDALFLKQERYENTLPSAPPPQKQLYFILILPKSIV